VSGNVNITPQYVNLFGSWNGGWSQNGGVNIGRTGKTITLGFPFQSVNTSNNPNPVTFSVKLPEWARPSGTIASTIPGDWSFVTPMLIKVNYNQIAQGYVMIDNSLDLLVIPFGNWNGISGWSPTSVTYRVIKLESFRLVWYECFFCCG